MPWRLFNVISNVTMTGWNSCMWYKARQHWINESCRLIHVNCSIRRGFLLHHGSQTKATFHPSSVVRLLWPHKCTVLRHALVIHSFAALDYMIFSPTIVWCRTSSSLSLVCIDSSCSSVSPNHEDFHSSCSSSSLGSKKGGMCFRSDNHVSLHNIFSYTK